MLRTQLNDLSKTASHARRLHRVQGEHDKHRDAWSIAFSCCRSGCLIKGAGSYSRGLKGLAAVARGPSRRRQPCRALAGACAVHAPQGLAWRLQVMGLIRPGFCAHTRVVLSCLAGDLRPSCRQAMRAAERLVEVACSLMSIPMAYYGYEQHLARLRVTDTVHRCTYSPTQQPAIPHTAASEHSLI